ncbi:MAG TPA: DUF1350 family protein [Coleofasciculaceae cyanobacterium]
MSLSKDSDANLHFQAFSHSWVAIHPNPKGIIQFVGSFFIFGSLPTVFYYFLLKSLYNQGYTIIAYPSSVIPPLLWKEKLVNHWGASIQLLYEESAIKAELIAYILEQTDRKSLQKSLDVYLTHSNYFWLGHSLGCKYISLLEILSNDPENLVNNLQQCGITKKQFQIIEREVENLEFARKNSDRQINTLLANNQVDYQISSKRAIIDQPSIFLAPEIYGTEEINKKTSSAIPFFGLFPDGRTTKCLINLSQNFFGLTALIAFSYDNISKDDIEALSAELASRSKNFIGKSFEGYDLKLSRLSSLLSHLKPLSGNDRALANCINNVFDELRKRAIANYDPQEVPCEANENGSVPKTREKSKKI